ncbi:hypothetical protein I3F58_09225 [Streptomyces sp. MUM 203J]|uniref:hypothetical protein n=1 Tax=Streptomyces sp. MUM 203J TaxID=2791990 RepID=UPI001F0411D2|nr:hypothetical protein [Streptomyces sp. MUM 203J]MCH0539741.1 hypothetical protein [Streptomyces sp. MUM 203J]
MHASRALAVAATACAVLGLGAPLAAAGGNGGNGPTDLSVSPSVVHQGGVLNVHVEGCNRGGTVTSNAFPRTHLTVTSSGQTATPRVFDHATPGRYNLAVRCNDSSRVATASFRVVPGRGAQGGLGGSVTPSSTEMAVGAGLVGTAALGGALFISRRRSLSGGKA